jgi:hypothetical protein
LPIFEYKACQALKNEKSAQNSYIPAVCPVLPSYSGIAGVRLLIPPASPRSTQKGYSMKEKLEDEVAFYRMGGELRIQPERYNTGK